MKILGENVRVIDNFDSSVTVPDCLVVASNKLGGGHGESKLYFSTKEEMRSFYGSEGFSAKCFLLKEDLRNYMIAIKNEYFKPTFDYRGRDQFKNLWRERMDLIEKQEDIIFFNVYDQTQISGSRGYVNSSDFGYQLIREISLPLVSYISVLKVSFGKGSSLFYWKLFVDYDALSPDNALVFNYGKTDSDVPSSPGKKKSEESRVLYFARVGQGKYRDELLQECPFCPITMINDDRILIASHIKPWAVSNNKERVDHNNGYILSPLYDKLFDRGFISFTDDRKMLVSNWIAPKNIQRMGLIDGKFFQFLPVSEERLNYLQYHRSFVFKG